MIARILTNQLQERLRTTPVVALLGSRQVGKTTLAQSLEFEKATHYLDLERPSDLAKLADPELYLSSLSDHLVVLDGIQRVPDLFPVLRVLVDERRRAGEKAAHFLLLGSASPDLLQQSSETLAGRISYMELTPFQLTELDNPAEKLDLHWERGGYPESYLATNSEQSLQWRENFIKSYVERHLPQQGIDSNPIVLRRLCTMLAHQHSGTVNLSKTGGSLGIDGKTVRRYVDLLEGLYLLRSLPPWQTNSGKRLIKTPKIFWRDSGILHALAGLHDREQLLGHPLCGPSWEGYCLEQIITSLPSGVVCSHYRTRAGAEIDLVVEFPNGDIVAVEIKRTLSPKLSRGLVESMETSQATHGRIIIPKGEPFPLSKSVKSMGLNELLGQDCFVP